VKTAGAVETEGPVETEGRAETVGAAGPGREELGGGADPSRAADVVGSRSEG